MTELLADRYELLERIGVGGMAEVFRARMVGPAGFQKVVALKRILEDLCADQDFLSRFIDEARLTARLQHPNICQVLDFGSIDSRYFITMEYIDGLDLSKVLLKLEQSHELLSPDLCLSITAGVLRGLSHAHGAADDEGRRLGLVHRDVSPQNVLLSINGDIKLSDFGVAKADALVRQARTMENVALGKLAYMAPEQRRGGKVDERTDVFGTGILLLEMLQGPAAMRRNAGALNTDMERVVSAAVNRFPSEVSSRVAGVIERAVEQKPERRYSDAISMLSEIEQFARELGVGATGDRLGDLVRSLQGSSISKSGGRPSTSGEGFGEVEVPARRDQLGTAPTRGVAVSEELATKVRRGAGGAEALATKVHRGNQTSGSALEAIETRVLSNRNAPLDELKTQVRRNVTRPLETEDIIAESVGLETSPDGSDPATSRTGASDLIDVRAIDSNQRGQSEASAPHRDTGTSAGSPRVGPPAPRKQPRALETRSGTSDLLLEDRGVPPSAPHPQSTIGPTPPAPSAYPPQAPGVAWPHETAPRAVEPEPSPRQEAQPQSTEAPPRAPEQWPSDQGREPRSGPASGPAPAAPAPRRSEPPPLFEETVERTARVRVRTQSQRGPLFWGAIVAIATAVTVIAIVVGWTVGWRRPTQAPGGAEDLIGVSPVQDAGIEGGDARGSSENLGTGTDVSSDVEGADQPSTETDPEAAPERAKAPPRSRPPVQPRETPRRDDDPRLQKRANSSPQRPGTGRGQARVSIYSDPPGVAYVDGRLVGPRTPVRGVEVSAGRHEIRVVFSSTRQEARRVVTVRPGGHEVVWLRD